MSILELKEKFHHLIDVVEDDLLLQETYNILEEGSSKGNQDDIIDKLTENQQARLSDSLQQMGEGKVITHQKLSEKIQKWLIK
jgi:hypothetical protein